MAPTTAAAPIGSGTLASQFVWTRVDQIFDLAEVMGRLVREKQLAGYEVPERFYEMGSPAGLAELETLLQSKSP